MIILMFFGNSNNVFKKCSEIYNKKLVYELVWVFMPRQYMNGVVFKTAAAPPYPIMNITLNYPPTPK
jgi:hypothetical protein